MKQIANVLVAAAFVCAAESAFAVVAARATRTVGAGCVQESGTNARPDLAVTHPISERKVSHENLMYPKVHIAIWL